MQPGNKAIQFARKLHTELEPVTFPAVKARGTIYFEQERVSLTRFTTKNIRAMVEGTSVYNVNIEKRKKNGDHLYCTCPFFRDRGAICKHIWATILTAENLSLPGRETGDSAEGGPGGLNPAMFFSEKEYFDQTDSTDSAAHTPGPGNFVLHYELVVGSYRPYITTFERYVKKDGNWGRRRRTGLAAAREHGLSRLDMEITAVLENIALKSHGSTAGYSRRIEQDRFVPGIDELEILLPLLAETGRCSVVTLGGDILADPLRQGKTGTRAFLELSISRKSGSHYWLRPILHYGEKRTLPLEHAPLLLNTRPVSFIADGCIYSLEGPSFRWLARLRDESPVRMDSDEVKTLVVQMAGLPRGPVLKLPGSMQPSLRNGVLPTPLMFAQIKDKIVKAEIHMDYDGLEVDPLDSRDHIIDVKSWTTVKRNPHMEEQAIAQMKKTGFEQKKDGFWCRSEHAAAAFQTLLRQGWKIYGQDRKPVRPGRISKISVSSGIDWFDMKGEVLIGDYSISLPEAARAYLKGNRILKLPDGSMGLLPEQWLKRNGVALEMGTNAAPKGNSKILRFHSSQALLIDAMLREHGAGDRDEGFKRHIKALEDFRGVNRIDVPEAFAGKLRRYQIEALSWLAFLEKFRFGGILADDMGLGKTVQVLAWLLHVYRKGDPGPSLAVAPTSVVWNWIDEAKRFCPGLKVCDYTGPFRRGKLARLKSYHLVVTSYGILRRDIGLLKDIELHYCILDESQAIKNPASQGARAVKLLRARHRLCLTGTPLENHLGELWSQMEFLNPGLLGPRKYFEKRFQRPVARGEKQPLELLTALTRPFILRRTKEMVAPELPEKVEHVIKCPMTRKQKDFYVRVRDHYRSSILASVDRKGINRSKIRILEGLLRLRQAAVHPGLIGYSDTGSGKMEELMERVEEVVTSGHKALIFSQFTRMLSLIKRELDSKGVNYEYLDGRTPQKRRQERIKHFQEDRSVALFLISLKAGGLGLNLTAADYVFLVDPWWNPAVENQAVDRTHRIGQKKKVMTYRLISRNTVEDKIMELQGRKRELVHDILSQSLTLVQELTRADLETLFS